MKNYKKAISSGDHDSTGDYLLGFDCFVHSYYNNEYLYSLPHLGVVPTKGAYSIILVKSSSDSEAFDKYYELLDAFFRVKA